jgi:hypothetical protein
VTIDQVLEGAQLLGLEVRWHDGHLIVTGPKGPHRHALVKVLRVRKDEFLERFAPKGPLVQGETPEERQRRLAWDRGRGEFVGVHVVAAAMLAKSREAKA